MRALREWLARAIGSDGVTARAASVAERLTEAGLWHDALGVLSRLSTPDVFGETLARSLRTVPVLDAHHAQRWIERVEAYAVLTLLGLALSVPYWRMLGLL